MTDTALGSLVWLDPRHVWKSEPYHFTPWLRENIELLGQALGLEIDPDVQQEVAVGLFSADLLGTDLGSSAGILIENQLDQTDHSHLGQLITYASGLGTDILIWISTKVREEHRQALTWLNERTSEDTYFFGVEIELLQIDNSNPAPHFKVVVEPNEWQKQTARTGKSGTGTEPTEKQAQYRAFWADVIGKIRERDPNFTSTSPERAPRHNWCSFSAGRQGFQDNLSFGWVDGQSVVRAELYIDTGDKEQTKAAFDALSQDRDAIDAEFQEPLRWDRRDDIRACRIYTTRPGNIADDLQALAEYQDWLVERAFRIRAVFGHRVKTLTLTPDAGPKPPSPADYPAI
jgi:hypothetical protein